MAPDHPTLRTARTGPEILEAVARFEWWERQEAECPTDAVPSEAELREWLPQCPSSARDESERCLRAMFDSPIVAEWSGIKFVLRNIDKSDAPPLHAVDCAVVYREDRIEVRPLDQVHAHLLKLPADNWPRHPLAPLVAAWQERPRKVEPDSRKDSRIIPRIAPGTEHPGRRAGMLFGGLHEGRRIEVPELPLLPEVALAKRVPLLDLVDEAGLPVMAAGRGAPLVARLFVRTLASVKIPDRRLASVQLAVTLRELIGGLFPNKTYRPVRDWPKLRHALIHARDYAIHDGRGCWFPVALRYLPDWPGLDDLVVFDVAFPPESATGPTIDLPEMDRLSVQSAARWRAYIAAHSLAWCPGVTRVPVPSAAGRFGWSRNPAAYPIMTLDDRRRLAFGARDRKHRTRTEIEAAFRDLPGLVILDERASDPRTGEVGWRIVPADSPAARSDDDG